MSEIPFGLLTQSSQDNPHWIEEGCFIHELLNHPLAESSIARARVPIGEKTRWHTVSVHEWYIVESGKGQVELDFQDGFEVLKGMNISIPPNTPQRILNTGEQELIFMCLCTPRFTPKYYTPLEKSDES